MPDYASIKESVLKKLEEHLPQLRERFGIETIGVFGSVARGEDTPESDIDILYKFSTQTVRLGQLMGLKDYLEELLGRNVDLIGINWIEPTIRQGIENEMILYQAESTVV
ncbi:nucleotidyltransferase family protein [Methanorbis furvi]|uniref:protein adenylyltransferase n=1 Tax=Methanorbis furvi TaxID=3028299 RepID=A0AAE4MDZ3_9EURY|nr:hypothetical protein [Methanocorpusculaceae archaeon Ag1]